MKKVFIPFIATSLIATSCGSIVNGSCQTVGINSCPEKASVYIDQQYAGRTPMKANLSRRSSHIVRVELEGYESYEMYYDQRMSKWVFGNIAFGGFVGLAIDAISGGMYKLTPRQTQAVMQEEHLAQLQDDDKFVTIVLHADPEWEKVGQLQTIAQGEDAEPSEAI